MNYVSISYEAILRLSKLSFINGSLLKRKIHL